MASSFGIAWLVRGRLGVPPLPANEVDEHLTRTPRPLPAVAVNLPRNPSIVISVPDRALAIVRDGKAVETFTIAVGKPSTPTPTGLFHLSDLDAHPTPVNGVFGDRWMEFTRKTGADGITTLWGIHGTNHPEKVGEAVSHGCIRMRNQDVEKVFAQAYAGEPVEITDRPLGLAPASAPVPRSAH